MPPGSTRVERRRRSAENDRADGAVGCVARPLRPRVACEHLVAAARQHCGEHLSDEALADHEHPAARHTLGPAQHACEGLEVRAERVLDSIRQLDPFGRLDRVGEATGDDRRRREALAGRLVPGDAAGAFAAGEVVDQRDAGAVVTARHDLVAEHRAGRGEADLLDVGAAEPAREHADRIGRRGRVREAGLSVGVEHDRAHASIVELST